MFLAIQINCIYDKSMEKIVCKNCGAAEIKKNGFVFGVQRYQCKKCGHQFTKTSAQGKDARDKATALALCQLGISQNQVAHILSLTPTTIARWLKDFPKNIPYTFDSTSKMQEVDETTIRSYIRRLYIENRGNFGVAVNSFSNGYEVDILIKNRHPDPEKLKKNLVLCGFGDSILEGIIHDAQSNKYTLLKDSFVNLSKQELNIVWKNFARHGSTVIEGEKAFLSHLAYVKSCDYVVFSFGANECNHNWDEISQNPRKKHGPRLSLEEFHEKYVRLIQMVQKQGKVPILLTMPPVDAERFFENIRQGRNEKNILKIMNNNIERIHTWHSMYNLEIFKIALETNVPVTDITTYFLKQKNYRDFLCDDGIHPNLKGHALIAEALRDFYKMFIK